MRRVDNFSCPNNLQVQTNFYIGRFWHLVELICFQFFVLDSCISIVVFPFLGHPTFITPLQLPFFKMCDQNFSVYGFLYFKSANPGILLRVASVKTRSFALTSNYV